MNHVSGTVCGDLLDRILEGEDSRITSVSLSQGHEKDGGPFTQHSQGKSRA